MFFQMFGLIFGQVFTLFLLVACGFILGKLKVINNQSSQAIATVCLYVAMPCAIALSFYNSALAPRAEIISVLRELLFCFIAYSVAHLIMILSARALFHKAPKDKNNVMRLASVYTNCGFFSLPVIAALSDSHKGTLYVGVYLAVFNLLYWTHGIKLLNPEVKINAKRLFLNPGMVGVLAGLGFMGIALTGVSLSAVTSHTVGATVIRAVEYLSAINTPLPMILIGYYLSNTDFASALKDGLAHFTVIIRMVVFPTLFLFAFYAVGMRGLMLVASVCVLGAPVYSSASMLTERYGQNTDFTVQTISVSMILSLITLPVLITIAQILG
ncbi:MAG: AEC family transporter [Clostridia bacterium]|nr:AEC family transporter [Clostridia bacterium]